MPERALERAVKVFCGEVIRVHAAGRTDTGVHALGQVAHIDLAKDWPAETVRNALNAHLRGEPIVVLAADVAPEYNAGSSGGTTGGATCYRILNRLAFPRSTSATSGM